MTIRSFFYTLFAALFCIFCITMLPACGGSDDGDPGEGEAEGEGECGAEQCNAVSGVGREHCGVDIQLPVGCEFYSGGTGYCRCACWVPACLEYCEARNRACADVPEEQRDCDALCGNSGEGEAEGEAEAEGESESEGEDEACQEICDTWPRCSGRDSSGCEKNCASYYRQGICQSFCGQLNQICRFEDRENLQLDCNTVCGSNSGESEAESEAESE